MLSFFIPLTTESLNEANFDMEDEEDDLSFFIPFVNDVVVVAVFVGWGISMELFSDAFKSLGSFSATSQIGPFQPL